MDDSLIILRKLKIYHQFGMFEPQYIKLFKMLDKLFSNLIQTVDGDNIIFSRDNEIIFEIRDDIIEHNRFHYFNYYQMKYDIDFSDLIFYLFEYYLNETLNENRYVND